MACAARPAPFRSTRPPSAGSARALVRVLRHDGARRAPAPAPLPVRPRHARVGHVDRAGAGRRAWRGEGGSLVSAGVVPTPAIAYLTPRQGFTAGVVISASHNPFEDNGIKVFSGAGEKFTEVLERQVEAVMADASWTVVRRARRRAHGGLPRGIRAPSRRDPAGAAAPARHADCGGLRQRRDHDGGAAGVRSTSASTRRSSASIPTGATSTCSAAPRIRRASPKWWSAAASRWASRSTATAIARSSWTRRGADRGRRRRDADVRQGPQGRGPSQGRRRRGHGDEQHRARDRAARRPASPSSAARWATST